MKKYAVVSYVYGDIFVWDFPTLDEAMGFAKWQWDLKSSSSRKRDSIEVFEYDENGDIFDGEMLMGIYPMEG